MKTFATDVTHKYVYGILFMLLSLVLFPHTAMTVLAYFFFASMVVALVGYIFNSQNIVLIANGSGVLLSAGIALGLLISHWEWMLDRD